MSAAGMQPEAVTKLEKFPLDEQHSCEVSHKKLRIYEINGRHADSRTEVCETA